MLFEIKNTPENISEFIIKKCTKALMSNEFCISGGIQHTQDIIGDFPVTPTKGNIDFA